MKVIGRAGVASEVLEGVPFFQSHSEFTDKGEFLGGPASGLQSGFIEKYGWPMIGISRTRIQTVLLDNCRRKGVVIHTGWRLAALEEVGDAVLARSEDGREELVDLVVGADGIKSRTRELITLKRGLEVKEPDFTGIAILGGLVKTPKWLEREPSVRVYYGATVAMINHTLENGMCVWGLNYGLESAVAESWRTIRQEDLAQEVAATLERLEGWAEPVRGLIAGSQKIMTIGLYDRPELPAEQWHYNRCVLVGDAAHPTT